MMNLCNSCINYIRCEFQSGNRMKCDFYRPPQIEPDNCGNNDTISRSGAIKAIEEKARRIKNEDTQNGLAGAIAILFELPPVIPIFEQWKKLKKTITEMRDNDGTSTQQEVCKFLANYMDVLEKQMQEPCDECRNKCTSFCGNCKEYDEFEPCEDTINRERAIKDVCFMMLNCFDADEEQLDAIETTINEIPPATPKSGKWRRENFPNSTVVWFCNKCSRGSYRKSNYCPNCGAKMESENKE